MIEDGPVGGAGTNGDVEVERARIRGISEDEGASDIFPLALHGPLKVTARSSRFQQFFFTYATLMAGLRLSKVNESEVTPLALHKAVISVGKPSLEELCCAIKEISHEMICPKFMSIFWIMP